MLRILFAHIKQRFVSRAHHTRHSSLYSDIFVFPVLINLVSSLSKTFVFSLGRFIAPSGSLTFVRLCSTEFSLSWNSFRSLLLLTSFHCRQLRTRQPSFTRTEFRKKKVATRPQSCYGEKEWRKISNKEIWLYYYNSQLCVYITYILSIY